MIGSPGFNNSAGGVYVIPGSNFLTGGPFNLAGAEGRADRGHTATLTTPGAPSPAFFGASVSGRLTAPGQTTTADSDAIADFIVGAPGYAATQGNGFSGGAFVLEGRDHPAPDPDPADDHDHDRRRHGVPTFPSITATSTSPLNFFVFSNATITPPFDPVQRSTRPPS